MATMPRDLNVPLTRLFNPRPGALWVAFVVPGQAVPKGRARTFVDKRTQKIVTKTPKTTAVYENKVRFAYLRERAGQRKLEGPLYLGLHIFHGDAHARDDDNVEKGIRDALNNTAYGDDRQIREKHVVTSYDRQNPRVEVVLVEVDAPLCPPAPKKAKP